MRKTTHLLYKIAFILSLVFFGLFLASFVLALALTNVPEELTKLFDFLKVGGIILAIYYGLAAIFAYAAMVDTDKLPSWVRPHVAMCIFGIGTIVGLCAAVLGLINANKQAEKIEISKKKGINFLGLTKLEKFVYNFVEFFIAIGRFFKKLVFAIGRFFKKLGIGIGHFFVNVGKYFVKGSWKTKVSYLVMGFGNVAHKQILRGILFFVFEAAFIVYMILVGGKYLGQIHNLGTVATVDGWDYVHDVPTTVYVDNSFNILLWGVMTLFFIVAFAYTWYLNIKQAYACDMLERSQKHIESTGDDIRRLIDEDFYKTMLALPLLGIIMFTILPIFFMILIAFTNYDGTHQPPANLFGWVGFQNFSQLFTWNNGAASFSATFGEILIWTLVWAFFATFTNYFLGLGVAMLINKKGIRLKKVWRTILVFSIAIPQFISLLYVSKLFGNDGIVNGVLNALFGVRLQFWANGDMAKVTVILINIWIGIPYLMLITTGILMNIPADLYESSKIDGANAMQQFRKITLPYMLFVTGPYLLTSFTGNMNNFNVIYLLTGGGPKTTGMYGTAGKTDLLITWLYSLTMGATKDYKMAAVIGIMVFLVVAVLSLVVYNVIPSTKNEEDFQ